MVNTGQCPACYATNSFSATNCLDCQHRLPWADAITNLQQKADQAAQDAAALKNAQAQNQQVDHRAQIAQSIQDAQVARAQKTANRQPGVTAAVVTAPGTALPVNVFHVYVDAFVGRFAEALEDMDKASAAWFGMFCMIASNVCIVIGLGMIVRDITNLMHSFMPFAMPTGSDIDLSAIINGDTDNAAPAPASAPNLVSMWRLAVVALTPWLAIAVSCAIARKMFGGEERHLEGDVFIAGVTLMPTGLFVLFTGMLGYANWRMILVLAVFCLTYTILLLYRGLTTISLVRDMAAALCVPLVIISSYYLAWMVFTRLVTL